MTGQKARASVCCEKLAVTAMMMNDDARSAAPIE